MVKAQKEKIVEFANSVNQFKSTLFALYSLKSQCDIAWAKQFFF